MPDQVDVVLVDDADDVRRVVEMQLRLDGRFRVVGVGASGAEAIDLVSSHHPGVIVLDVSMPELDGLSAIEALRAASPETAVVFLSGFAGPEIEQAALARGAAAYLDKGMPIEQLPDRLHAIAVQGGEVPPSRLEHEAARAADAAGAHGAAEEVMALHLERFRTVFDQATIGMATMTLTGRLVRANAQLAQLLHAGDEAGLIGVEYAGLATPEDAPAIRSAIGAVAAGRQRSSELDHGLRSFDEVLHVSVAAVRDDGGRPLYLFAQVENVTERRRATEELRRSEERFRLFVESVRDYAIFMLDQGGHITSWNLGAQRLKGYAADEIIGQHFRVFYPEEQRAVHHPEHELEMAVRDGRYQEEGWRIRKDGSRFFANVTITALFNSDGTLAGFGKVTRDVTDQQAFNEARERAASELAEANASLKEATDAMASFVAVVAHELRSPVAAVAGAADLLEQHWDDLEPRDRAEMLTSIRHCARQLSGLVSDLLLASRLESGVFEYKLTTFALGEVISDSLADLRATIPDAEVACDPSLAVLADRDRVGQILTNLLSNADKHGARPIRVVAAPAGEHVELRVYDGGEALPRELTERLFQKFSQGPGGSHAGTGLGLFIVRQLARGQGGEAWYEATAEGTSCFAISLPAAAGDPPSSCH